MNDYDVHFINGAWLAGSGPELVTIDPSTGKHTWSSNESTSEDVQTTVQTAHDAFES